MIKEVKVPKKKVNLVLKYPTKKKKKKSQRCHKVVNLNPKWSRAKEKKHKNLKISKVPSLRVNNQSKKKKNTIQRMKMNPIPQKTKEMKGGKMLRIIRN